MAAHCPLLAFLCLSAALLTAGAAAVGNDQGCPEGWTLFGTRCFKFFESRSTWTESEKSCQSHGANLASIHSSEENAFVIDLIEGTAWIGGNDAVKEKLWVWSDGSAWDYSKWYPNRPSNSDGSDFALIHLGGGYWNNGPETWSFPYVCAKNAPDTEATDAPPKAEPEATDAPPKAEPEATDAPPKAELEATDAPPKAELEDTDAPPKAELEATDAPPKAELEDTDAPPIAEPEATDAPPKAEPRDKSVSLTLEGFLCKCVPDMK